MTWTLDEVELSFGGPESVFWGMIRKQTAKKIVQNFPTPVDIGPDSMELTITGKLINGVIIDQLREIVKRAEKETAQLTVTDPEFDMYTGLYAVGRSKIGQKGPQFDPETGSIVQDYTITLVQFAEGGLTEDGDTGDKIGDEDGVGFGDIDGIFEDILLDQFPNIYDLIMG
jgi:hypothetical protein